ncbi:hypothetical protein [Streptomyces sp. CBMA123]|uniref:hypothetical protein n=1 Tax=Streptomyces sp. CBMA123 TaxID=1896313 RepID=UPI0016619232|nr:hypothetical protein [Streptomyces sp. CBMA123]MBD0693139.1 hypothetical protein [Streptomyces sp. CBMA123]
MESTGLHWLAQVAADPEDFREQWERTGLGLVLLPAGRRWDVLAVAGPLGRAALDVLGGLHTGSCGPVLGPVLADFGEEHVSFLMPVGTAARWVGTGVRCAGEGTWIVVPHPGRSSRGVRWLVPPDGSGRLNDPVLLELALHEAAAGLGGW